MALIELQKLCFSAGPPLIHRGAQMVMSTCKCYDLIRLRNAAHPQPVIILILVSPHLVFLQLSHCFSVFCQIFSHRLHSLFLPLSPSSLSAPLYLSLSLSPSRFLSLPVPPSLSFRLFNLTSPQSAFLKSAISCLAFDTSNALRVTAVVAHKTGTPCSDVARCPMNVLHNPSVVLALAGKANVYPGPQCQP